MKRAVAIAGAVGLSALASSVPALAGQQVYTYVVVHPIYGEIGTFTDTIDRNPGTLQIDGHLRVAVTFLGIVAYREESDTTEVLRGNRLMSLQSVTDKDGRHFEVHGEAQGDQFIVNATLGSYTAPASIIPSDPWVLKHTGNELVISTASGRMMNVQVSGGEYDTVSMNGNLVSARHYIVNGSKRQDVWLDSREIPIMFRTLENGTPIDFVLRNTVAPAGATAAVTSGSAGAHAEDGDK